MSKDPAVLFYTSDFLAGTAFFTMEERGQYITLLCEQHQCGPIPEHRMNQIIPDLLSIVRTKFKKTAQKTFENDRMKQEKEKRVKYCKSRSKNRMKSNKKTYEKHMSLHMENENENEYINSSSFKEEKKEEIQKKEEIPAEFLAFFEAYPGSGAKNNGWKQYKKKHKDWKESLPLLLPALQKEIEHKRLLAENKQFVPEWKNLETWINKRCWEQKLGKVANNGNETQKMWNSGIVG